MSNYHWAWQTMSVVAADFAATILAASSASFAVMLEAAGGFLMVLYFIAGIAGIVSPTWPYVNHAKCLVVS